MVDLHPSFNFISFNYTGIKQNKTKNSILCSADKSLFLWWAFLLNEAASFPCPCRPKENEGEKPIWRLFEGHRHFKWSPHGEHWRRLRCHTHCLISENRNVASAQLASGSDRVQKFFLTKLQISKNRTLNSRWDA